MLFLRYALPCTKERIKDGGLTQEEVDAMTRLVLAEETPDEAVISGMFPIAVLQCKRMAISMKRGAVDSEIIRRYFLLEHNSLLDKFSGPGTYPPSKNCKIRLGTVMSITGDSAVVKIGLEPLAEYGMTLCKGKIRKGDEVDVHYDSIVERMPAEKLGEMRTAGTAHRPEKLKNHP